MQKIIYCRIKNIGQGIIYIEYKRATDGMWQYQVAINPNKTINIWYVEGTFRYVTTNPKVQSTCSPFPPPRPTRTPKPTKTPTATPTKTQTPTPSFTPTNSETPTQTPTNTQTPTTTQTPTETPTNTPTNSETNTPTPTETPTETPTNTPTETPTNTPTNTNTPTITNTPTNTITPSSAPFSEVCLSFSAGTIWENNISPNYSTLINEKPHYEIEYCPNTGAVGYVWYDKDGIYPTLSGDSSGYWVFTDNLSGGTLWQIYSQRYSYFPYDVVNYEWEQINSNPLNYSVISLNTTLCTCPEICIQMDLNETIMTGQPFSYSCISTPITSPLIRGKAYYEVYDIDCSSVIGYIYYNSECRYIFSEVLDDDNFSLGEKPTYSPCPNGPWFGNNTVNGYYIERCDLVCLTPTPTPTNTSTPTQTPTESETPTPTPTNTETPIETPTNTPTETETPTPTPTNTETPTNTPTETETSTPTPTNTETPTETPTNTPTETETSTPTPTNTETPTNTPTNTETPTNTPTPSETPTQTPTQTLTETPTQTPSQTPTKACLFYEYDISQNDLDSTTGNTSPSLNGKLFADYVACADDSFTTANFTVSGQDYRCVTASSTPSQVYGYKDDVLFVATLSTRTSIGGCPLP